MGHTHLQSEFGKENGFFQTEILFLPLRVRYPPSRREQAIWGNGWLWRESARWESKRSLNSLLLPHTHTCECRSKDTLVMYTYTGAPNVIYCLLFQVCNNGVKGPPPMQLLQAIFSSYECAFLRVNRCKFCKPGPICSVLSSFSPPTKLAHLQKIYLLKMDDFFPRSFREKWMKWHETTHNKSSEMFAKASEEKIWKGEEDPNYTEKCRNKLRGKKRGKIEFLTAKNRGKLNFGQSFALTRARPPMDARRRRRCKRCQLLAFFPQVDFYREVC